MGGGSVHRGGDCPFGPVRSAQLRDWADGKLDLTGPGVDPVVARLAVAERFGWQAVSGGEPMTYEVFAAASQLLLERKVGKLIRQAEALEDRQVASTIRQLEAM